MRGWLLVGIDLDDMWVVLELLLEGDFLVDHFLEDGVAAVVLDDLEGVLVLIVLDYVDVAHSAFPDLPADLVAYALDFNLIVQQHGYFQIIGK